MSSNRRDLLVRIDTQFDGKGMKSAEQSAKALERELNKVEREERQLANMQMAAAREAEARRAAQLANMEKVGRAATLMGGAIALGLGIAGKAAMDWETAWAGVTKTVNGSTSEMAALEGQLRGLARTLPASHEEIAGVAEAAGQLGVKRQDVAAFTKTMIDLGVSTNLSSEEAATGLAKLNNIMGVTNDQVDRAGATIVALGNNFATTEADILAMSLRIGGAGKTIGLTEAQVMGFSAALSSVGIEAEMGGSAISRVFVDIANAVDTGGESLDQMAALAGMTGEQFKQSFQQDAAGAIVALIQGLGQVQAQGGSTFKVLDDLGWGNIRIRDTMLRASGASDVLTQAVGMSTDAWKQNLALLNEANKRYQTSESRIKIARNELTDAAIDIGAVVLPAFAGAAERVGALANAFRELPDWAKTSAAILGSVASAALLLGGASLMLVPKLVAMTATLEGMGARGAAAARGLRAAGSAMAGPWGIALAGATVLLGVWAEKQYKAKAAQDELASSLDQQTGAITASTKAIAAKKLQDEGLLDVAEGLGISLSDLTDAALGNEGAMSRLADAAARAQTEYNAMTQAAREGKDVDYDALVAAEGKVTAYNRLIEVTGAQRRELEPLIEKTKQQARAVGEDTTASGTAAQANDLLAGAFGSMGDAADKAQKELDDLIKAVEGFGDTTVNALEGQAAYQAAIDKATESLKKNKVAVNKSKTAFNLNTEAGRSNQAALLDIADSALKSATANFQNGASVKSVSNQIDSARSRFIDMAKKMGLNEKAAKQLADKLGLTRGNVEQLGSSVRQLPSSKTISVKVLGIERASANVSLLRRQITDLHGKTVTVTQRLITDNRSSGGGRYTGGGSLKQADGGTVDFYGSGGLRENHIAQIAPAGAWRVWAEDETGGEGYIPLAPSKRASSIPVWFEVGRRLGVLEAGQSGQVYVTPAPTAAASPTGPMRISGVLDLGDGLKGFVEGVIENTAHEAGRKR